MRTLFKRLGIVFAYAIAMAWVESAVVVYLRTLIGRVTPYQTDPLPVSVGLGWIEVGREIATLVMLFTVGWLAGQTWRSRTGYSLIAFGTWDIFYYIFLVPMSGWPQSLLDWDVLFLVPLPWWGPVLSPVLISLLLISGGTLAALGESIQKPVWPRRWTIALNFLGIGLALYTFMLPALQVVQSGEQAVRQALPTSFNWALFGLAFILLAAPIVDMVWQLRARAGDQLKPMITNHPLESVDQDV
ncbi:MAG TPA: hypothetical protein VKP08_14525 [Anaerolineales bacterium]|nr:hypothetical protein [Anaerolineales bacterium]